MGVLWSYYSNMLQKTNPPERHKLNTFNSVGEEFPLRLKNIKLHSISLLSRDFKIVFQPHNVKEQVKAKRVNAAESQNRPSACLMSV